MSLSDALSLLPDIHIHASLVLCALVFAWMVAIHRGADAQSPTRHIRRKTMSSTTQKGPAAPQGEFSSAVQTSGPRRSLVSLARAARPSQGSTAVSSGAFTVRWDRTAIFAVSALALLTAVITALAALFGAATGAVAGISLGIAVLGVVGLRLLALRDRKHRTDRQIEAAFQEAASPVSADRVFDASASAPWAVQTTAPSTAVSSPQVADSGPAQDTAADSVSSAATPAGEAPSRSTKQAQATLPSVPRPTYLDAPEAIRPDQKPLELPEVKVAQPGTRLKDGVSAEYQARMQASAQRTLDLDKVLERRRAV